MPKKCSRRMTTIGAIAVLSFTALVNVAEAHGAPLPDLCVPPNVVENVCTARLKSVTADVTDGTITGAPVGGGAAITLTGPTDAYLKSAGFGGTPPDPVQRWDAEIERIGNLSVDPSNPSWYNDAKAVYLLPRTLNDFASRFPPGVLVVRFTPYDDHPGWFWLVSIQPVSQ
ncbi:hypothetical protein LAUMK4_00868 [Mycobacterium persicum]|uniref:Secreted protein n=2 Tax=Mycobacterium persicum TaxID=1487726 RepID=A0AB38UNZ0_9MYCO|nr:hypothetical protein LAUMK15_01222 [Mycobacterium persicum]VAZ82270.1 hypothetical protein LAUMK42_01077 [Mycobacterium persicum]VAZ88776.1 hypothetical protein LAUMK4_00868 [Mycobacterium persicum]